jgi:hypothetical protein
MTSLDPQALVAVVAPAAWPTVPTWRYLGDRTAADTAYCIRFGTDKAPEPAITPGGLLAYALPGTEMAR